MPPENLPEAPDLYFGKVRYKQDPLPFPEFEQPQDGEADDPDGEAAAA